MAFTNLLNLTESIESHEVTRADGAGEDIEVVFNRKSANNTVATRAFVEYAQEQDIKSGRMVDYRMFFSVKLGKSPNFGDLVKYNNETYKIVQSKKHNAYSSLYDIKAEANSVKGRGGYGY